MNQFRFNKSVMAGARLKCVTQILFYVQFYVNFKLTCGYQRKRRLLTRPAPGRALCERRSTPRSKSTFPSPTELIPKPPKAPTPSQRNKTTLGALDSLAAGPYPAQSEVKIRRLAKHTHTHGSNNGFALLSEAVAPDI